MKLVFDRQKICTEMLPLMCAVSGKSTLSASEGILMEAKKPDVCVMTTFDLEKGMQIEVNVEVLEEGCYIINAQKLLQTMRVMDSDKVILTVDEQKNATIENESLTSSYKMGALAPTDFPELPRLVTDKGYTIGQGILKKMFAKVAHAMGVNDQRPVLNGCFCRIQGKNLRMVTCDSFKVAKCETVANLVNQSESGEEPDYTFNIPVKTVNELQKMLSDDEEENVRVYMSRRNIVFHFDDKIFFSRLIDGEYIDYERIIMKNHKIFVTVKKEALLEALERAGLVTEERVVGFLRAYVKLEIKENTLLITATSTIGSTYEEVPIVHDGEDLVLAFTNRYLIDSVKACSAETVKISLSTAFSSVNIEPVEEPEDGGTELFMLLPVRMRE